MAVQKQGLEPTEVLLAQLFDRSGYFRVPNEARRHNDKADYKKGWEVRLSLRDGAELKKARRLLREMGMSPGKPFAKAKRVVQPVYGAAAVASFQRWHAGIESKGTPTGPRERATV